MRRASSISSPNRQPSRSENGESQTSGRVWFSTFSFLCLSFTLHILFIYFRNGIELIWRKRRFNREETKRKDAKTQFIHFPFAVGVHTLQRFWAEIQIHVIL